MDWSHARPAQLIPACHAVVYPDKNGATPRYSYLNIAQGKKGPDFMNSERRG
jgi:hypothetical protein